MGKGKNKGSDEVIFFKESVCEGKQVEMVKKKVSLKGRYLEHVGIELTEGDNEDAKDKGDKLCGL